MKKIFMLFFILLAASAFAEAGKPHDDKLHFDGLSALQYQTLYKYGVLLEYGTEEEAKTFWMSQKDIGHDYIDGINKQELLDNIFKYTVIEYKLPKSSFLSMMFTVTNFLIVLAGIIATVGVVMFISRYRQSVYHFFYKIFVPILKRVLAILAPLINFLSKPVVVRTFLLLLGFGSYFAGLKSGSLMLNIVLIHLGLFVMRYEYAKIFTGEARYMFGDYTIYLDTEQSGKYKYYIWFTLPNIIITVLLFVAFKYSHVNIYAYEFVLFLFTSFVSIRKLYSFIYPLRRLVIPVVTGHWKYFNVILPFFAVHLILSVAFIFADWMPVHISNAFTVSSCLILLFIFAYEFCYDYDIPRRRAGYGIFSYVYFQALALSYFVFTVVRGIVLQDAVLAIAGTLAISIFAIEKLVKKFVNDRDARNRAVSLILIAAVVYAVAMAVKYLSVNLYFLHTIVD